MFVRHTLRGFGAYSTADLHTTFLAQGFIDASGATVNPRGMYEFAVQQQLTAEQVDAAVPWPAGTAAHFVSAQGWPALLGPQTSGTTGRQPGDVFTDSTGSYEVQADGTLKPYSPGGAQSNVVTLNVNQGTLYEAGALIFDSLGTYRVNPDGSLTPITANSPQTVTRVTVVASGSTSAPPAPAPYTGPSLADNVRVYFSNHVWADGSLKQSSYDRPYYAVQQFGITGAQLDAIMGWPTGFSQQLIDQYSAQLGAIPQTSPPDMRYGAGVNAPQPSPAPSPVYAPSPAPSSNQTARAIPSGVQPPSQVMMGDDLSYQFPVGSQPDEAQVPADGVAPAVDNTLLLLGAAAVLAFLALRK